MALATTVSSPETATVVSSNSVPAAQDDSVSTAAHAVPARHEIRMGRAATTGDGLNWLTLMVIGLFHVGALAALFLFSWPRLVVMAVLYVLAINVGIGMCRSEEHTSELQSLRHLVCRLLLEKKNKH